MKGDRENFSRNIQIFKRIRYASITCPVKNYVADICTEELIKN